MNIYGRVLTFLTLSRKANHLRTKQMATSVPFEVKPELSSSQCDDCCDNITVKDEPLEEAEKEEKEIDLKSLSDIVVKEEPVAVKIEKDEDVKPSAVFRDVPFNDQDVEDHEEEVEVKPFTALYLPSHVEEEEEEKLNQEGQVKIFGLAGQYEEHLETKPTNDEKHNFADIPLESRNAPLEGNKSAATTQDHQYTSCTSSEESFSKCDICGKKFILIEYLKKHLMDHVKETQYKCTVCFKSFKHSSNLSVHIRVHTGETPYKCTVCDKTFKHSSNLTVHMRVHTGESPYKCTVCCKSFKASYVLTRHMRIHSGEFPFKCTVCNKGFRQSSKLTIHMRVHTGETPYKCAICKKGFKDPSKLTIHMRVHTGETPYKCIPCCKSFQDLRALTVHMKIHSAKSH